ncbi:uncharacterized protein L201_003707 [Kwoniella dendrophila CBS 6074]|uniref:Uncharacterized protein n=1 Tax=Kwoniella dendrophila CBS 6074 TaxID=1295534 RepID=A0AAX4JVF7_9TREE
MSYCSHDPTMEDSKELSRLRDSLRKSNDTKYEDVRSAYTYPEGTNVYRSSYFPIDDKALIKDCKHTDTSYSFHQNASNLLFHSFIERRKERTATSWAKQSEEWNEKLQNGELNTIQDLLLRSVISGSRFTDRQTALHFYKSATNTDGNGNTTFTELGGKAFHIHAKNQVAHDMYDGAPKDLNYPPVQYELDNESEEIKSEISSLQRIVEVNQRDSRFAEMGGEIEEKEKVGKIYSRWLE